MKLYRSSFSRASSGKSNSFFPNTDEKEKGEPFFDPKKDQQSNQVAAKTGPDNSAGELVTYDGRQFYKFIIDEDEYKQNMGKKNDNGILYQFSSVNFKRKYHKLVPVGSKIAEYPDKEVVFLEGKEYLKIEIEATEYHMGKGKSDDNGKLYRSFPDPSGKRGVRHYFKYVPYNPSLPPPRLYIQFIGGQTKFKDKDDAVRQLQLLADYLKRYPKSTVHLTGNTGSSGETDKEGSDDRVMDQDVDIDGKRGKMRDLQLGRARQVQKALISNFHIDPNRITIGTGTYKNDDENRFVGVEIKGE